MPKKPGGPNVGVKAEDGSIVSPRFYKKMGTPQKKKMMGTNADQRSASTLKGFDYGKGGAWKNPNGVQVGHSYQEDSTITPMKSTGDVPMSAVHIHLHGSADPSANYQKIAKLANSKRKRS